MATQKKSGSFDFQKLIDDSKQALMAPKDYFASMSKEGGLVEPVIKAVIYGLIAGIVGFVWSLLSISSGGMVGTAVGVAGIFLSPIYACIGLFIGAIIILVISAISGGSTDFEANARV
ncbi:MAG: hypothetical protein KKH98_08025, partial [Spirochaetes bacterium]|nr:hypothetical protein [Spirochaetota bacterium]